MLLAEQDRGLAHLKRNVPATQSSRKRGLTLPEYSFTEEMVNSCFTCSRFFLLLSRFIRIMTFVFDLVTIF